MALIRDLEGQSVELLPIAYEFPKPSKRSASDDEANGLEAKLTVTTPTGSWERQDPCLLTWSFLGIASWMRRVAAGNGDDGWYYPSVEENLALGWEREGSLIRLKLLLAQEFTPPGPTNELRLLVRPGALRRFADQLERDVEPFPIRTWGDDASTARIAKRFRRTMLQL